MPYSMLLHQIQNFTPDGTGLDHDDAVDTLAMAQEIVPAKGGAVGLDPAERTILSMLRNGERYLVPGVPLLTCLPIEQIPDDIMSKVLDEKYEASYTDGENREVTFVEKGGLPW